MKQQAIWGHSNSGATLDHFIKLNPTTREIDAFYRQLRLDLKFFVEIGEVEKKNGKFHLVGNNQSACGIYMPAKRWFALKDIVHSKKVFKKHRDKLGQIEDWNDIEEFKSLMKKLKINKPILMAHLIFSAWKHENLK